MSLVEKFSFAPAERAAILCRTTRTEAQLRAAFLATWSMTRRGVANDFDGLMHSNSRKDFLRALTPGEIFLLHLRKDDVLELFNLAFQEAARRDDFELLRRGAMFCNRLRMLESAAAAVEQWLALDALAVSDSAAAGACFADSGAVTEPDGAGDDLLPLTLNLLVALTRRRDELQRAAQIAAVRLGRVSARFDRALVLALTAVASGGDPSAALEEMFAHYRRCRWLHGGGYYGKNNLFKHCPLLVTGVWQLARAESVSVRPAGAPAWAEAFAHYCANRRGYEPLLKFGGELAFLDGQLADIAVTYPQARQNIRRAWAGSAR